MQGYGIKKIKPMSQSNPEQAILFLEDANFLLPMTVNWTISRKKVKFVP